MIRALWSMFFGTRLDMMTGNQIEHAAKMGDLTFAEMKQLTRWEASR